mmetsp:Transcript_33598/g.95208  ORF Transcript_33598/g.95208 Transcript_33598/m.95208 type:complete len:309 (+) Transcript_33598:65-991(+)
MPAESTMKRPADLSDVPDPGQKRQHVGSLATFATKDAVDHSKVLSHAMELNMDKSETLLVRTSTKEWLTTSQSSGVARRLIERRGGDIARATTVVRFAPNQSFPEHTHTGGEEFVVLDGTWRDGYGDFPKYCYIRNFIGSSHTPRIGEDGCVILVKLCQMHPTIHPEPQHTAWTDLGPAVVRRDGLEVASGEGSSAASFHELVIFGSPLETVKMMVLPGSGATVRIPVPKGGRELLVVDGQFTSRLGTHDERSWCRLADEVHFADGHLEVTAGEAEVYLYSKEGHLASAEIDLEEARGRELNSKMKKA